LFIERGQTKSRSIPGPRFFLAESRRPFLSKDPRDWALVKKGETSFDGIQITESDGNRWPPPKGGDLQDHGSEFYSQRKECVTKRFPHTILYPKNAPFGAPDTHQYRIEGNLIANVFEGFNGLGTWGEPYQPLRFSFPPDMSSSRASLNVKGAIAVAAVNPGNPIASAATAIGEALQDVPRIPGIALWESRLSALGTLAAAGSEFLNYEFGIAPSISDMHDFLKAVHTVDKVIDQFVRDSGRNVRRRYAFPKENSETETWLTPGTDGTYQWSPAGQFYQTSTGVTPNAFAPNRGAAIHGYNTKRRRTVEREIWFSGAFTYHMPRGYDNHLVTDRRRLMAKLFGAEPDLNTLWNLAPWSWAVDWFTDAGALVKNLQSKISYGTVLRYGYVMEKTTVTDTYSAWMVPVNEGLYEAALSRPHPGIAPVTLRTTTKKRIKANPFGFGISWDGLSTTQQAIVAALGITRAVR